MSSHYARHTSSRVWFITGSSTGFGRVLSEAVLSCGERLVATARRPEQLQKLVQQYPSQTVALPLDMTNQEQAQEAVAQAIQTFGRIDVLVNNAGYGLVGAVEEADDAEVRKQFETNVFGTLNVTRAVLPIMRQQQSGHILMLSSVGGFIGSVGFGIYNASKFAIEGFSEALAQEVAPLGISVTIVEPGYFRTDLAGHSLAYVQQEIEDYAQTSGRIRERMEQVNDHQPGDPARAAQTMIKAVESMTPPLRLVLGAGYYVT
jgi:NAD(P)-dependent dehydrogenase (short-subunit alcohol dehydrogenase family)